MSEYTADLEIMSAILRVLPAGSVVDVDPYSMAAASHWLDRRTVELKGTTSKDDTAFSAMRGAVCEVFAGAGVETVIWTRKRRGRTIQRIYMDTATRRIKRPE